MDEIAYVVKYKEFEIIRYFKEKHAEFIILKGNPITLYFNTKRFVTPQEYRKAKIIKINNTLV